MRATIFIFFALYAVAVVSSFGVGGLEDYPKEKWTTLEDELSNLLLAFEKRVDGERLVIVRLNTVRSQVVAGVRYEINVELLNNVGETLTCNAEYIDGIERDTLVITCPNKTYTI